LSSGGDQVDGTGDGGSLHGALVLRGNRCILARSLETPPLWHGMRLPALAAQENERPVDTARRAVAELCDVDCLDGDDDEFIHVSSVLPIALYTPRGTDTGQPPRLTQVHVFYAVNPPPVRILKSPLYSDFCIVNVLGYSLLRMCSRDHSKMPTWRTRRIPMTGTLFRGLCSTWTRALLTPYSLPAWRVFLKRPLFSGSE
jgi:hypothetical protein